MTVFTRSAIIGLFHNLVLQGSVDPLWTAAEKDFYFNEAADMVHAALVEADLDLFITRGAVISHAGAGVYPLPDDCYAVKWVQDAEGPYRRVDHYSEQELEQVGYVLADENLLLVNVDADQCPSTLTLDYVREPKEIPAWDGTSDPETIEDDVDFMDYQPDFPLNTSRGARCLARIIQSLAQSKDQSASQDLMAHVNSVISRFVDRMVARAQSE